MKTVFVNAAKCVGCRHCEIACAKAHATREDMQAVLHDDPRPRPRISVGLGIDFMKFPNRCRHCDPAPCHQVCPTGAIYRDEALGSVLVNEARCISCGMCAMVCPFNAIRFYPTADTATDVSYKCDDCIARQAAGRDPACVEACKTGALVFGEVNAIIDGLKKDVVMDITRDIKGMPPADIPGNIRMFQGIKEKVAQLGPLPSSK